MWCRVPDKEKPCTVASHRLIYAASRAETQRLRRAHQDGLVEYLDRGLYADARTEPGPWESLISIALRRPHVVIWGASALEFYGLGTLSPPEVQIAIPPHKWSPKLQWPSTVSNHLYKPEHGIISHDIAGVQVQMTSRERTLVDVFRRSDLFSIDIAIEALKHGLRDRVCHPGSIMEMAINLDAQDAISPYLAAVSIG